MLRDGIIFETMSEGLTNLMNDDSLDRAAVLTSLSVSERKPMNYETSFCYVISSPRLSARSTILSATRYLNLHDFSSPYHFMFGIM